MNTTQQQPPKIVNNERRAIWFGVAFLTLMVIIFSPSDPKPKSENFLENITVTMVPAATESVGDIYHTDVDITIYNQNDFAVTDIEIACKLKDHTMHRSYFNVAAISSAKYPNVNSDFTGRNRWDAECIITTAKRGASI